MNDFSKKAIQRSKTLGERLKKVREESGLSLQEASVSTQIQENYLAALEEGDYARLPGPVYIESFLKKYATFLKVSSDFVLNLYTQQEKKVLKKKYRSNFFTPKRSMPKSFVTPKLVRNIIIGLIIGALLTYLVFEVVGIFSPPDLIVNNPADFSTVTGGSVEVTGLTEPESQLTINGEPVILSIDGSFSVRVDLVLGVNKIIISATKKRSKEILVERHVVYNIEKIE